MYILVSFECMIDMIRLLFCNWLVIVIICFINVFWLFLLRGIFCSMLVIWLVSMDVMIDWVFG